MSAQTEEAAFSTAASQQDNPTTYVNLAGLQACGGWPTEEALAGLAGYEDNDLNVGRLALCLEQALPSAQTLTLASYRPVDF